MVNGNTIVACVAEGTRIETADGPPAEERAWFHSSGIPNVPRCDYKVSAHYDAMG